MELSRQHAVLGLALPCFADRWEGHPTCHPNTQAPLAHHSPPQHRDPPCSCSAPCQPPAHHSTATAWLRGVPDPSTSALQVRPPPPHCSPLTDLHPMPWGSTSSSPAAMGTRGPAPCRSFTLMETRPGNALTAAARPEAAVCAHLLVTGMIVTD